MFKKAWLINYMAFQKERLKILQSYTILYYTGAVTHYYYYY